MTMKKMKMTSPINFVMILNMMMISVEVKHGEMSWENPSDYKSDEKNSIYFILHPHSINLIRMYTTDAPIIFVADAPTVFIFIFVTLLFIAWITLILWVCSVITRDSTPNDLDDVELANCGQLPPPPPLTPSTTTLPLSPS
jgi:hypothetical protein